MTYRLLSLAGHLDQATLRRVYTHTSWAPTRCDSYERLEFLGDSVLGLCVTTELYRRYPSLEEGQLARLRAYVVSRATCAKVAIELKLGELLVERANGRADSAEVAQLQRNDNVLADLTEALIGAVYITFGYEATRPAVIEIFDQHIAYAENSHVDYKTELQEHLARNGLSVTYAHLGFHGPPHNRTFEVEALVGGEVLGSGSGTSKKRAEQEAAEQALRELEEQTHRPRRKARLRSRRSLRRAEVARRTKPPVVLAEGG